MHRLILGWLNCPEVAPADLVDVASRGGFHAVGLRITGRKPGDGLPSIVRDAQAIARVRARADAAGVVIHNVSAYHLYPTITARDFEPVLDAAARLKAATVLVGCYDDEHVRFAERMAAIADLAAARNVRVVLEFVPFSACKTLAAARAIADDVDRPNFGLIVDPLHLARSGGTPDEIEDVPRARIAFVQLCDAPETPPAGVDLPTEARSMRLVPGAGALPLRRLLEVVAADIDVECEFPTQSNLAQPPEERVRGIHSAATTYLAHQGGQ